MIEFVSDAILPSIQLITGGGEYEFVFGINDENLLYDSSVYSPIHLSYSSATSSPGLSYTHSDLNLGFSFSTHSVPFLYSLGIWIL